MLAALLASGIASWFTPYRHEYDGGRFCAMRDKRLIGRRVRIYDDRGHHQTCVVIGTGPFARGRILDVSPLVRDDFRGFYHAGTIHVRVYSLP